MHLDSPPITSRPVYFKVTQERLDSHDSQELFAGGVEPAEMCEPEDANLIASLRTNMKHTLVLDLDHEARLVPSSTAGHYHLFIDVEMTWNKYIELMRSLQFAGVLQQGFVEASRQRGFSAVRHNCKKPATADA